MIYPSIQASYWSDDDCSEWSLTAEACEEAKKNASIPVSQEGGELVYDQCYTYNVTGNVVT